jgi:hypothetical protein
MIWDYNTLSSLIVIINSMTSGLMVKIKAVLQK